MMKNDFFLLGRGSKALYVHSTSCSSLVSHCSYWFWQFLLRPLSEAFLIQVGDERDTCSLPDDKHSGSWIDNSGRANLRLLKRKHRVRGSHMQRPHSCGGHHHNRFACLPCRLRVALSATRYGQPLFNYSPAEMMRMIKQQSNKLGFRGDRLTWTAFRAGHAIHLVMNGFEINVIMMAG